MKLTELHDICEKAKSRNDGVYSHKEYMYVVKNNHLLAFTDYSCNVYQFFGAFNVIIGKCERYDRRKNLMNILRNS